MLGIIGNIFGGLFQNGGVGSWIGRLLGLSAVGEATGTVDIAGMDMAGLPWWAILVMVFFWLSSERNDFDSEALGKMLTSGKKK